MRGTQREAETRAEGEGGSMQGARRGTRTQVSRIMPWAEGGAKPLSHGGCPAHELLTGHRAGWENSSSLMELATRTWRSPELELATETCAPAANAGNHTGD